MKLRNIILSTALLPFLSFAATQPAAPTMNDVSSFTSCVNYAQSIGTYLQDRNQSNDFFNGLWFNGLGLSISGTGTAIANHNGVSTTYTYVAESGGQVSGQVYGCDVLEDFSSSTQVKTELLKNISAAYKQAMANTAINTDTLPFTGYGVYGPTSQCSIPSGKFSNCTLFNGSIKA